MKLMTSKLRNTLYVLSAAFLIAGLLFNFLPARTGFAAGSSSSFGVSSQNLGSYQPQWKKITICHIAGLADDPANFVVLELPPSSIYGVHLDEENGTGLAGHEEDFLINDAEDLARCAASGTPTSTSTPTASPTEEDKITICHIAGLADDPANFVVLNLPPSAIYGVHVDEANGTGLAGHEDDFIINDAEDLARCAPVSTPTPTLTPTDLAGVEVIGMCLGPEAANYGWRVSNPNNFPVDFEWRVNGSLLAGLGSVAGNSTADFVTPKAEGTIIMIYVGGEIQDSAAGQEDCQVSTETPEPTETPVVPTPPVSSDPTVLIPVTGIADELPVSLPTIFLNLGFGFFGLGLVAHGLNRRQLEKITISK